MDVTPAIKTASRDFYLAYLNSRAWRDRRRRALQLADWQCQRCPSKRGLEVHHKTYERLGREWDQDLEVLCDDCHIGHHLEVAEETRLSVYLKLARQAIGQEPFVSIADLNADLHALCAKHKIPQNPYLIGKALGLVAGEQRVKTPRSSFVSAQQEPVYYAALCSCRLCREAGVSERRLRMDPHTREWIHGQALKDWYTAFQVFQQAARRAAGARGRHALGFEPLIEEPSVAVGVDI